MDDPEPPLSRLFAETERNLASLRTGHFSNSSPSQSHYAPSHIGAFHPFTEQKESMPLPSPALPSSSGPRSSPLPSPLPPSSPSSMSDADYKLEAFSLLLTSLRTSLRTDLSLLSTSMHQKTSSLRSQFLQFTEEAVRDVEERVRAKWEGREADRDLELHSWRSTVDEDIKDIHQTVDDTQYHLRMKREEMDRTVKALEKAVRETKVRVEVMEKKRGDSKLGGGGGSEGAGVDREVKRLRDEVEVLESRHTSDVVEVRREVEERWLSLHTLLHDLRGVVDVLMAKEEKEWERRRDEREERKTSLNSDLQALVKAEVTELWTALRDNKRRTLSTEDHMKENERRVDELEGKLVQQGAQLHKQGPYRRVGTASEVEALERSHEERWAERDRADRVKAEEDERRWEDRLERLRLRMEKDWATKLQTQQMELDGLRLQVQRGASASGVGGKRDRGGEWDEENDGSDIRPSQDDLPNSAGSAGRGGASRVVVRLSERLEGLEEQLHAVETKCQRELRQAQSAWNTRQADDGEEEEEQQQRLRELEEQRKEMSELKRRQGEVEVGVRTLSERVLRAEGEAADERRTQQQRLEEELQVIMDRLHEVQATQQTSGGPVNSSDVEAALTKVSAIESRISAMEQRLTLSHTQYEAVHAELRQQQLEHTQEAGRKAKQHRRLEVQSSALQSTVIGLTSRVQAIEERPREATPNLVGVPEPPPSLLSQSVPAPALSRQPQQSSLHLKEETAATVSSLMASSLSPLGSKRPSIAHITAPQIPPPVKVPLSGSTELNDGNAEWEEEVEEEMEEEDGEEVEESSSEEEEEDEAVGRKRTQSAQEEQEREKEEEEVRAEADRLNAAEEKRVKAEADRIEREKAEAVQEKRVQAERMEAEKQRLKAEEEERLRVARVQKEREEEAAQRRKREEEAEEAAKRKAAAAEEQRRLSHAAEQLRVTAAEEAKQRELQQRQHSAAAAASHEDVTTPQQSTAATLSAKSAVPTPSTFPSRRPPISVLANRSVSSSDDSEEEGETIDSPALAGSTTRPTSRSQEQPLSSMLSSARRSGLVSALGSKPTAQQVSASSSPALSSASPSPSLTHMPSLMTGHRPSVSGTGAGAGASARFAPAPAPLPSSAVAVASKDELDDFDLDLEVNDFLDSSKGDNDFYID